MARRSLSRIEGGEVRKRRGIMPKVYANQNGFVLPMVLFLTSLLFSCFLFVVVLQSKTNVLPEKDFHHLVLNYRVEGGLYLAVEQIRSGILPPNVQAFSVQATSVQVTLRNNGAESIELFGYGEMPPSYASGIGILLDKKTGKILEWRDGG